MNGARRLYLPVPTQVRVDDRGRPRMVDGRAIEAVRETWLVEDRWWTHKPLRRRYWEVVSERGELIVLFRELVCSGGWFRQRGGT